MLETSFSSLKLAPKLLNYALTGRSRREFGCSEISSPVERVRIQGVAKKAAGL